MGIGSSCTIEAFDDQENLDEGKLEECGDCFENADTEEKAKTCTIEHLPYFYDECKIWIESPTAPLEEVLQCFIEVVKFFDAEGEVHQGVKDYPAAHSRIYSWIMYYCYFLRSVTVYMQY